MTFKSYLLEAQTSTDLKGFKSKMTRYLKSVRTTGKIKPQIDYTYDDKVSITCDIQSFCDLYSSFSATLKPAKMYPASKFPGYDNVYKEAVITFEINTKGQLSQENALSYERHSSELIEKVITKDINNPAKFLKMLASFDREDNFMDLFNIDLPINDDVDGIIEDGTLNSRILLFQNEPALYKRIIETFNIGQFIENYFTQFADVDPLDRIMTVASGWNSDVLLKKLK